MWPRIAQMFGMEMADPVPTPLAVYLSDKGPLWRSIVLLCVYSTAGLQRVKLGAIEKYGEVLSGAFILLVGVVFWLFPVL